MTEKTANIEQSIFTLRSVHPMLIAEQVEPYDDPDSIFELKLDGIRVLAYCDENGTDLRNKRDMKMLGRFPELSGIHLCCKERCILDGELNVLTDGKPDFYAVQKRALLTDPFKIKLLSGRHPANFAAFDILYYKDRDVTGLPLMERKALLDTVGGCETDRLSISRYVDTNGKAFFELVKEQELEGIVGKKKNSLYYPGKRTKEWKKIKWMQDEDFICVGYLPKKNNMTGLLLCLPDGKGGLRMTGHVTLGVSLSKLKGFIIPADCPFTQPPKDCKAAVWTQPFVCTVQYMPSPKEGMRQPVFKGVREDKTLSDFISQTKEAHAR